MQMDIASMMPDKRVLIQVREFCPVDQTHGQTLLAMQQPSDRFGRRALLPAQTTIGDLKQMLRGEHEDVVASPASDTLGFMHDLQFLSPVPSHATSWASVTFADPRIRLELLGWGSNDAFTQTADYDEDTSAMTFYTRLPNDLTIGDMNAFAAVAQDDGEEGDEDNCDGHKYFRDTMIAVLAFASPGADAHDGKGTADEMEIDLDGLRRSALGHVSAEDTHASDALASDMLSSMQDRYMRFESFQTREALLEHAKRVYLKRVHADLSTHSKPE